MDPEVVAELLTRRSRDEPLRTLTPREREVLGLMAEGRSNAAIAGRLFVTDKAVGKHTNNIFSKLGLLPSADDNRRVRAVLAYLQSCQGRLLSRPSAVKAACCRGRRGLRRPRRARLAGVRPCVSCRSGCSRS